MGVTAAKLPQAAPVRGPSEWGTCEICKRYSYGHQWSDGWWRCGHCSRLKVADETKGIRIRNHCSNRVQCDWPDRVAGLLPARLSLLSDGAIIAGHEDTVSDFMSRLQRACVATGFSHWQIVTNAVQRWLSEEGF